MKTHTINELNKLANHKGYDYKSQWVSVSELAIVINNIKINGNFLPFKITEAIYEALDLENITFKLEGGESADSSQS